jgi:hypothetical protein
MTGLKQSLMHFWERLEIWREPMTKVLLVLTLLVYPFNNFPFGPFAKLTFYPLLLLLVLNVDRIVTLARTNKYLRYLAYVGGAWALWSILSLFFSVGFQAIGAPHVKSIAGSIRFFVLWYTFIACCFLLPRDELKRLFYWTFVGLLGYCSLYSILEILHFSGVQWATRTLETVIQYFLTTGITEWTAGNVWPPILWDSERYRSIFEEPSYYSILLGFTTLFFASFAWVSKRFWATLGNLCLAGVAVFFLCKTKSAAGAISLAIASCTWVFLSFCLFFKMTRLMRFKMIAFVVLLACGASFALVSQRHTTENIKSLVCAAVVKSEESTEKTTRAIHLGAELECIKQSPIYGYGMGEYDKVMREALKDEPYKPHELQVWLAREGALPWLNWFTGLAVMYGLVGLGLFLGWFLLPLIVVWFKRLKELPVDHLTLSASLAIFLVFQMTSANTEIFCYMLLMSIPVLLVIDAPKEEP